MYTTPQYKSAVPGISNFSKQLLHQPSSTVCHGGLEMPSSEGTAAMPMYAIGIIHLMSAIVLFAVDGKISINTSKMVGCYCKDW